MADWFDEGSQGDSEDPYQYADWTNPETGESHTYEEPQEAQWDPSWGAPVTEGPGSEGEGGVAFYNGGPGQDVLDNLNDQNIPYQIVKGPDGQPTVVPVSGGAPTSSSTPGRPSAPNVGSNNYPGLPNRRDYPAPGLPSLRNPPNSIQPWTEDFKAPSVSDMMTAPGFQARLSTGMKALEASAASKGTLLTGGTLKSLMDYGQDSASEEYGNIYNRAFNEYDTRRQNFLGNETNRFGSQSQNWNGQFGQEQGLFGMGNTNRMNSFGIDQGIFGMGQDQRMNDFNIWSGQNNDQFARENQLFSQFLQRAQLTKPPYPTSTGY